MKRIPPIAALIVAVFGIIGLALGGRLFRWEGFTWAGTIIIFSLALIGEQRANELDRKTIEWQARVINDQGQFIQEIITKDIDGRE